MHGQSRDDVWRRLWRCLATALTKHRHRCNEASLLLRRSIATEVAHLCYSNSTSVVLKWHLSAVISGIFLKKLFSPSTVNFSLFLPDCLYSKWLTVKNSLSTVYFNENQRLKANCWQLTVKTLFLCVSLRWQILMRQTWVILWRCTCHPLYLMRNRWLWAKGDRWHYFLIFVFFSCQVFVFHFISINYVLNGRKVKP